MNIIKAGWLIQDCNTVHQNSGLVLENGLILDILPNRALDELAEHHAISIMDARDSVIAPGFVNTHMHQYGLLSHGMTPKRPIQDFKAFLEDYWWPNLENRINCQDVLLTTRLSAAELVQSGVTTLCDILEAPFVERGALIEQGKALGALGMRGIVSLESSERVDAKNGYQCLEENVETVRYFNKNSTLVKGAICTHTTFTCSQSFIKSAAEMAKSENTLYHFHLSESSYEPQYTLAKFNKLPLEIYEAANALSSKTMATQCVKMELREMEILNQYACKASHMPLSNCEVGGGVAPVPEMLSAGISLGLGSDGYINDFFEVMRAAFLIHKADKQSPLVMPASMVFKLATESGAECLGLTRTGKLQKGFTADFMILENEFLTPLNESNIFDQLIVFGKKEFVSQVFVNGKSIYQKGNDFYPQIHADRDLLRQRCNLIWNQ
ncbi:MAG: amidohydrolase family protein [Anaerolineaceae bacterium]|nr:amidohydrolase family protein [Anaerolineaceae bacterium]